MDLSLSELQRTLASLNHHYQYVGSAGLFGTYEDGLVWLHEAQNKGVAKLIMWMGASIENLGRHEAADFLKKFKYLLGPRDAMLIGIDACQDRDKVFRAYNDSVGKTREFYLNGLAHANRLFGREVFKLSDWEPVGEYDLQAHRHQAFYVPNCNVSIEGRNIKAGTKIKFEESYKYTLAETTDLWKMAGLVPKARFKNDNDDYREFCLCYH